MVDEVTERRKFRLGFKVVHRHRMANKTYRRVSELVFVDGNPRALLGWIDLGGIRTPLCVCDLEPSKLSKRSHNVYAYDGVTADPRFEDALPAGRGSDLFLS